MNQQLERFPGVVTLAGAGLFIMGLLVSVVLPLVAVMNRAEETASLETLAAQPTGTGFETLAETYPEQFETYWSEGPTPANYADALERGRDLYIANACFQCHTQQVRPFAHEIDRYGAASTLVEQNNALQKPALLGLNRVGPDLARAGQTHDIDYWVGYFWDPDSLVPGTAMPAYRWLYEEEGVLNQDGFALLAYIDWLGDYQPVATTDDETESE